MVSFAQYHVNMVAKVAAEAHERMMRDARACVSSELYCWYTQRLSMLHEAENKPHPDSELSFPERIPGHLTREQLTAWLAARAARVPYLSPEVTR